jgi:transcriptional repressor NrdR
MSQLAQQVEEAVRSTGAAEVPAHDVGLAILGPLRDLDEVAYMRFASVYRGFDSLDDFEAAIGELRAYQELASTAAAYEDVSCVPHFGDAHDPAPPPVHVPSVT